MIKRRIRDSELARLRVGEPERLAYGPAEIERLDACRTGRDAAPVFVFIHGGAGRSGPRVMRIYDTCVAIPAFADAHPAKQPDEGWAHLRETQEFDLSRIEG